MFYYLLITQDYYLKKNKLIRLIISNFLFPWRIPSADKKKIVIIPVYPDIARMAGNQVDSKLGNKIIDSIAHTLIVPVVRTAVSNMGIPSLDMNNIIIVDRGERAPR